MSEKDDYVEKEIKGHISQLKAFVSEAEKFKVNDSQTDVVKRFIRDCNVLIEDVSSKEKPSICDLNDYSDRFASQEIQFQHLKYSTNE